MLSQAPIIAGICQFYGDGNAIGAWQGACGAGAGAEHMSMPTGMASDGSASTSSGVLFRTMTTAVNNSMSITTATGSGMIGNTTIRTGGGLATQTTTPGLQSPDVPTSGVASLREDDWARRMMFKALLAMGSAEVIWAFVPV